MKKILIIDDDYEVVEFMKNLLEKKGYFVNTASDGVVGLTKAKNEQPDLIVLDIGMPHINGHRFIREIKEINEAKNIAILVCSGKDLEPDVMKAEGINHYLTKPVRADVLFNEIIKIIGK